MSSFELKIYFVGLIAWVPRYEDRVQNEVAATAVLPRVVKGHEAHKYVASNGVEIETHFPGMFVCRGSCSGYCLESRGDRPEFFSSLNLSPKDVGRLLALGAWDLDRVSIRFELPPVASSHQLSAGKGNRFKAVRDGLPVTRRWPQTRRERQSLLLVPEMERICTVSQPPTESLVGGQVVQDAVLNGDTTTHSRVAALVQFDFGTLSTAHVVEVDEKLPSFDFRPMTQGTPRPNIQRALADYVSVSATVEDPEGKGLAVKFRSFSGETRMAVLQPEEVGDKKRLELWVTNRPPYSDQRVDPLEPAAHFEVFYELSDIRNRRKQIRPVPHGIQESWPDGDEIQDDLQSCELIRRGGFGRPICPQAQFSAVSI